MKWLLLNTIAAYNIKQMSCVVIFKEKKSTEQMFNTKIYQPNIKMFAI